jgi:hypothetical protein
MVASEGERRNDAQHARTPSKSAVKHTHVFLGKKTTERRAAQIRRERLVYAPLIVLSRIA